jgi:hypothetical protein
MPTKARAMTLRQTSDGSWAVGASKAKGAVTKPRRRGGFAKGGWRAWGIKVPLVGHVYPLLGVGGIGASTVAQVVATNLPAGPLRDFLVNESTFAGAILLGLLAKSPDLLSFGLGGALASMAGPLIPGKTP